MPWGWVGALRAAALPAAVFVAVQVVFAGRYGYHRDELYFVEAGFHPAWAYPDQPAAVPLLAASWWSVIDGSLTGFRVLPAVVAAGVALVAALTARELAQVGAPAGGPQRPDAPGVMLLAAAATTTASTLLAVGHLFSTTTFDALATAVVVLLLLRAVRTGTPRAWLLLGAGAGLACHIKLLPLVVLGCCALALLLVGPRRPLRSPWPLAAAALALFLASPVLVWQASNGSPQLDVARSIAAGGSSTSVDRWLVVPLQVTLVGPLLVPLMVVGLVRLWRSPLRWVSVAYVLLLAQVVLAGGKPYYTLGVIPVLLAASAAPVLAWVGRSRRPVVRGSLVVVLVVANLVGGAATVLPWLPARDLSWQLGANPDLGEQVGWPELVDVVEQHAAVLPAESVVLTENYGQAGALAMARRAGRDLPPVRSGHQGFWWWGPPPEGATTVVVVGSVTRTTPAGVLTGCREVARVSNDAGVDNEEMGQPVAVCTHTGSWAADWPRLQHLG